MRCLLFLGITLTIDVKPLSELAHALYLKGLALVQSYTIEGIDGSLGTIPQSSGGELGHGLPPLPNGLARDEDNPALQYIRSCWIRSVMADPRCWESWTSLRHYGLLNVQEEMKLIESINWNSQCGDSDVVGTFLRDCFTATIFQCGHYKPISEALGRLIKIYPSLASDPAFLILSASRNLALGSPRKALAMVSRILEQSPFHSGALAIKATALTLIGCKSELFKLAHYIADYHGVSVLGLSYNQAAVINSSLASGGGFQCQGSMADPLLAGAVCGGITGPASSCQAWLKKGLSSVPVYPCAIGPPPVQGPAEQSISPCPASEAFPGPSLAWYAIGCYYLTSAAHLISEGDGSSASEVFMSGFPLNPSLALADHSIAGGNTGAGPTGSPLSPAAERALTEARRWLAKCTWLASRSFEAWLAFAQTFVLAREWEPSSKALYTAVSLGGLGDMINASRLSQSESEPSQESNSSTSDLSSRNPKGKERDSGKSAKPLPLPPPRKLSGSQAIHIPLVSLGSVYLRMGDLQMGWSCFDAAARQLTGWGAEAWARSLRDPVESLPPEWKQVHEAASIDPLLLNEIGTLYYQRKKFSKALEFFRQALATCQRQASADSSFADIQQRTAMSVGLSARKRGCTVCSNSSFRLSGCKRGGATGETSTIVLTIHLNLGSLYRKIGKFNEAIEHFDYVLNKSPDSIDALLGAAFSRHFAVTSNSNSNGNDTHSMLDEAIEMYHKVLAVSGRATRLQETYFLWPCSKLPDCS